MDRILARDHKLKDSVNCRTLALALLPLVWGVSHVPAQSWTLTSAPLTNWTCLASSADGMRLVAAGWGPGGIEADPGPIYTSTNGGNSWTGVAPIFGASGWWEPLMNWRSVASSADGTTLFAVGEAPGDDGFSVPVFLSTNAGATWEEAGTNNLDSSWSWVAASADGNKVVAFASYPPGMYLSTNSGATWTLMSVTNAFFGAWSADGTTLVVGGWTLAVSRNLGATWTTAGFTNVNWSSVAASADGSKLVATASPGLIYTSMDAGTTWAAARGPSNYWTAVASSADGTKIVATAGYYGSTNGMPIYTSTDSGITWTSNNAPDVCWVSVASSADGCKVVASEYGRGPGSNVGAYGGIYGWQTIPEPVLSLVPSSTNLLVSWTVPSMATVLQQSSSLAEAHWTDVGVEVTLNYSNLKQEVRLQPAAGPLFYRLASR